MEYNEVEKIFNFIINEEATKSFSYNTFYKPSKSFNNFKKDYDELIKNKSDNIKSNLFQIGSLAQSINLMDNNTNVVFHNHLPLLLAKVSYVFSHKQETLIENKYLINLFANVLNDFSNSINKVNYKTSKEGNGCLYNIIAISKLLNYSYMIGNKNSKYNRFHLINVLKLNGLKINRIDSKF